MKNVSIKTFRLGEMEKVEPRLCLKTNRFLEFDQSRVQYGIKQMENTIKETKYYSI